MKIGAERDPSKERCYKQPIAGVVILSSLRLRDMRSRLQLETQHDRYHHQSRIHRINRSLGK